MQNINYFMGLALIILNKILDGYARTHMRLILYYNSKK